ncbi:MAG TPA: hypothetical protein VK776_15845 [Bryobacteraceae bacterium]|nr:hypothetical protein [Bryobacteraceae bacterium]
MHYSRVSAFLLGGLLIGSLFMGFVATGNFQTVNEILKSPPPQAEKMIQQLGAENARLLLRYQAGEENRLFFESWEMAQLVLGLFLAGLLFLTGKSRLLAGLAGAMVILTIFQHFKITPELIWQGRSIDFATVTADPAARQQFFKLHAAYGVMEVVKLLLMVAIGVGLFPRRRRSTQRVEIDAVDYAHHRHVDG